MVWTLVWVYAAVIVLLHIPSVQGFVGGKVADALGKKLGTEVRIGRVDLGFLNRLVITDVLLYDQQSKPMLRAARLSVNAELTPLLSGRISITSAQLFGVKALLYQERAGAKPNFQFVVDSLASKDTTKQKTPLDLNIHSLIIRNSEVSFDRYDVAPTHGKFNTAHIKASDISAHLILNRLTPDSINFNCKRLSFKEASGLNVKSLAMKLTGGGTSATLSDFHLSLPHSDLFIPRLQASYERQGGNIAAASLQYEGKIEQTSITLSDIACFVPLLKNFTTPLRLSSSFNGTSTTLRISSLSVNSPDHSLALSIGGSVSKQPSGIRWAAHVDKLTVNAKTIDLVSQNLKGQKINVPQAVTRLGDVTFKGQTGGLGKNIFVRGQLYTDAGNARLGIGLNGNKFTARMETPGINLGHILDDKRLGTLATHISVDGKLRPHKSPDLYAKGSIDRFDYQGYTYRNINLDGQFASGNIKGRLDMDDPNAHIHMEGIYATASKTPRVNVAAAIEQLNPSALKLTKKWPQTTFGGNLHADITGNNLSNISGKVTLDDFTMHSPDTDYSLDHLELNAGHDHEGHFVRMTSDFAALQLDGQYDYRTIARSITNLVASKLPTLPGLPPVTATPGNSFNLDLTLTRTDWMRALLGVDMQLQEPLHLTASMDDRQHALTLDTNIPDLTWNGNRYKDASLSIATPGDTLQARAWFTKVGDNGSNTRLKLNTSAANNHLTSSVTFDDRKPHGMNGELNLDARFFKNSDGNSTADMRVLPSQISIGDTIWLVHPSSISYTAGALHVDNFAIEHNRQYLRIGGSATHNPQDSITVDLKDVNVEYILNLVNFHSVDFAGLASGQATVKGVMDKPSARANLTVSNFTFEDGRMGTLRANVDWNLDENQINIHALADDGNQGQTFIHGYVSPGKSDIDLGIEARGTRLEFMNSLCSSFLKDVDAHATGHLRIFGPLKTINMEGQVVATGTVGVSSLGTTYAMQGDTVTFIPDNIIFHRDTIHDLGSGTGIVEGKVTHHNLSNFGYDLHISADKLLAYDFKTYGDQTFFGTVWATGSCDIKGKSGEVNIDVDVTPEKGSFLEYNAVSPDAVSRQEFITWHDKTPQALRPDTTTTTVDDKQDDMASDMHINFLVNTTPDVTLRVLMDPQSGDMITLGGNGVIRATYYNKGAFQMFGNYLVDHGTYRLTIQNVIRKDFLFQPGSTITFGGNPYDAALNLKAQYAVQGVSLSDLNVGRSFTSNTIRVNCLMNIGGTPGQPRVEFGMQLPTLSGDAEQLVKSLINTEEEMNQQVLYLLAVGRFYNSGTSTQEGAEQRSQTTLAMQSLLSGTLSQQINNVIGTLVGKSNWNFGANISTGDEGWNNAEYEGILSGRMLNNRLLFNGQFGYRDNANATTSFIGDFDLKYLLKPNGSMAVNIYNQTNDRYFTRNSLNTQGIGLLLKKDFTTMGDLFGRNKQKTAKSARKKRKTVK